jgi:peptidoglycan/LPS O-acetylase OafA/YrhL
MSDASTTSRALPSGATTPPGRTGGYLGQFDSYRIPACAAVVFQHSLLWTVAAGNVTAWALVMLLHFSRTAFFFLTALLLTYSQVTRPRSTLGFWRRRYVQLGVPYLVWTAAYWVYESIRSGGSAGHLWSVLWHDFIFGYYQLYFAVVLFQLYLVFPFLLRLLQRRRHHARIMAGSLCFALVLAGGIHWPYAYGIVGQWILWMKAHWPWSRDPLTYQEQFIAGILVALHLDEVYRFAQRWYRHMIALALAVGVAATLWYLVAVWTGDETGRASTLYQPIAFLWFTAAVAALECGTLLWYQWSSRRSKRQGALSAEYLAGLTGGIFFCHVLFIELVLSALGMTGLGPHLGWFGKVAVLYVSTLLLAGTFTALALRTPFAWPLTGPIRSTQRTRLGRRPAGQEFVESSAPALTAPGP